MALQAHRLCDDDDDVYGACQVELHRRATVAIQDAALALLQDERAEARSLGADVLGQLGYLDGYCPYSSASVGALLEVANHVQHESVLESVVMALSTLGDVRGLPVVLGLVNHAAEVVRLAVARALPNFADVERRIGEDDPLVVALTALTADGDLEVRSWATFGLACQVNVDGPHTRAALLQRVDDVNGETRGEALIGLARRRDPRAAALIDAALRSSRVWNLAVEAAGLLGDETLMPALDDLAPWDVDPEMFDTARRQCGFGRLERRAAAIAEFVAHVAERAPSLRVEVVSEVMPVAAKDGSPLVRVLGVSGEAERFYDFAALLHRAHGSVEEVTDILLADRVRLADGYERAEI